MSKPVQDSSQNTELVCAASLRGKYHHGMHEIAQQVQPEVTTVVSEHIYIKVIYGRSRVIVVSLVVNLAHLKSG